MFAIGIVGHNQRGDQAAELSEQVGAIYRSMDNGTLGCTGNHRQVWSWLAEHNADADYLVTIEDDAQPVEDFRHQLDQALAAAPTPVVGLYLGHPEHWRSYGERRKRLEAAVIEADKRDANWITTTELLHGVGIAIRTNLVPDMLKHTSGTTRPFDYAIRNWARDNRTPISFTTPSLLDHADGPALVNHRDSNSRARRKAWRAGTRKAWTSEAVSF